MSRSLLMTCCVFLTCHTNVGSQEAKPVKRIGEAPWRYPGASMVAYTPRGDRLITAGGGFRVWDTATGKVLHDVPSSLLRSGPAVGRGIAVVGPEGKQLATLGHTDRTV